MIGVGFLEQTAVFVLENTDAENVIIDAVGETAFPSIKTPDETQSSVFQEGVEELFSNLSAQISSEEQLLGLSFPSQWLHSYVLPVDPELDAESLSEFAHWSFQKRFGSQVEGFQPRFYTLSTNESQKNILTIAFPERLLQTFTAAAQKSSLNLSLITTDVFAGWGAIPLADEPQYLCKFTANHVVVSQSYMNELVGTGLYSWNQPDDLKFLRGTIRTEIAQEWLELLNGMLGGTSSNETSSIWIYGDAIPENVQAQIEINDYWAYVNPFAPFDIRLADDTPVDQNEGSKFAEVGGLIRQMIQDSK